MNAFGNARSIAILRGISSGEVVGVADVLAEAGIDIIEVTLNTNGALGMIETLASRDLGTAVIGAGTVTQVEEPRRIADAGGRIAISPNTNPAVIAASKRAGLVSLPGFLTPSEGLSAIACSADGLKLFPCEMASPLALKAMKAVLPPEVPIFAVGGISAKNAAEYLASGAQGLGIGSSIYKPGKSLADIAADAKALIAAMHGSGG